MPSTVAKKIELNGMEVWVLDLNDISYFSNEATSLLNSADWQKAAQFANAFDRKCAVASRILLKQAMADKTGLPACEIEIKTDTHGRPYSESCPLSFSVAHSGSVIAVALSTTARVGVDIEALQQMEAKEILACLNEQEAQEIAIASKGCPMKHSHALTKTWTLKEAFVKFRGHAENLEEDFRLDQIKDIDFGSTMVESSGETYFLSVVFG